MIRTAAVCLALSSPVVLGFNLPFSRAPHGTLRASNSLNRLRMVATPIRTDEQKTTGEEWQGTSTLDRQLVCGDEKSFCLLLKLIRHAACSH